MLTRMADQFTWTWIPWRWVAIGLAALLLLWLGWQYLQNKIGCALLLLVALVIFVTPFVFKFMAWRNSQDLSLTPLRATGVITAVERVTKIDPLPGDSGDGDEWETEIEAVQPYDIVVVRYMPRGYQEPVLGVDAIDEGGPLLTPAMPLEIAYAATAPRSVRIVQGAHSHHWQNPVEWLKQQALAGLLILALLGGLHWLGRWWQRLLDKRTLPVGQK